MWKGTLSAALVATACTLDDRRLIVSDGVCALPPADGLLTDFAAAVGGTCRAQNCPDDPGKPTVSLGAVRLVGLAYPYRSRGLDVITLSVARSSAESDSAALHAVMASGSPPQGVARGYVGVMLQFQQCIDTFGYGGVRFTLAGDLGDCGLRVALQWQERDAGTLQPGCGIDDCHAQSNAVVNAGGVTVPFAEASERRDMANALVGMQWEFSVPSSDAASSGCRASFTIDDVRLVPTP